MTPEEHEKQTRQLAKDVQSLAGDDRFKRVWAKLIQMAPPHAPAFASADGYNAHAAAQRDGASSITRYLQNLSLLDINKEPPPPVTTKADFVG